MHDNSLATCEGLFPHVRRVSSRTLALKRSMACGAIRRRGLFPPVKLKAQELADARFGDRTLGFVDPELETLARNCSMLSITRSPARWLRT